MPMDRRSPEEKREAMLRDRQKRQAAAIVLVNELHDAGFSGVLLDSTQIRGDGHYYCQVVIPDDELSPDRMEAVLAVAEVHDAKVHLNEMRVNQQGFSRIMLWPFSEGDDE